MAASDVSPRPSVVSSVSSYIQQDIVDSHPASGSYKTLTCTSYENESNQQGQANSNPSTYTELQHELSSRHSSASDHPSGRNSRTESERIFGSGASNYNTERTASSGADVYNLPPAIRPAVEEWKQQKSKKVEQRLISNVKAKKKQKEDELEAAYKLEKRLPVDVLAREWFNKDSESAEIRVYLIERLMPTLILGMEKVLIEAERRNLIAGHEESDKTNFISSRESARPKFNPIDMLGQYLMRNNPKFSNFPEASPYARGLRTVAEELKRQVFDLDSNKVAKLKHQASLNREEMETREDRKLQLERRRKELMRQQFKAWLLDDSEMLQLRLVQNALFSYLEISAHLSNDGSAVIQYNKELEPTDETGKTINEEQYVEFLEEHIGLLENNIFQDILHHLNQCALAFRRTFEYEIWNSMFVKLFEVLDPENTGYVDRHRMLHLLEKFWDKVDEENHKEMRNPRKWPVIELEELDDLFPESDNDDDSIKVSTQEDDTIQLENNLSIGLADDSLTTDENGISNDKTSDDVERERDEEGSGSASKELKEIVDAKEASLERNEQDKDGSDELSQSTGQSQSSSKPPATEIVKMKTPEEAKEEGEDGVVNEVAEEPAETESKLSENLEDDEKLQASVDKFQAEIKEAADNELKPEPQEQAIVDEKEDVEQGIEQDEGTVAVEKTEEEETETGEKKETEDNQKETAKNENTDLEMQGQFDMKQLLLNDEQAMTLSTPAISAEGDSSVAVKIEFSKTKPQVFKEREVRKTKSYSVVAKEKPQDEKFKVLEDMISGAGTDKSLLSTLPSNARIQDDGTSEPPTTLFDGSSSYVVQRTAADMDDYNPFLYPVEVKTRPASASRMSVTFAVDPVILPDKPTHEFFSEFSSRSQSRMTSVFDENQLNKNRFVTLLETFLTEEATHHTVEDIVNFIHMGYVETEDEKIARLAKARKEALSAKHRDMIDSLFNKWDNDGQGYIDVEAIEDVLSKYKGGMEASALKQAKLVVRQGRKHHFFDRKINKKEFHLYINAVCDTMAGGEEVFDGVIEFVTGTVERTYAERVRGEARRKWLKQINSAAECSGASMDPVYKTIFQTFFKDADAHGNQKKISAYVALLEKNELYPTRGDLLLRYVATTPDNAPYMLGKAFYEEMKGISFYCIRRGKLVHVPRVHSHGRVYFWNPERLEDEKEAALILLPLKDDQRRVFGLIGIDNMIDPADRSVFATHELNFYQGISKSFSAAFHHVDLRRKLLRIIDSAMAWIHSRAPQITSITIYFVEPDPKTLTAHVLRKMMFADNNTGVTTAYQRPTRLYRKDNLFRDYLFKCMESSETTTADAYGERHTAHPLRDDSGRCQCVIDMSIGKLQELPKHEVREMLRMLKLLQAANREIMRESQGGEKTVVLEAEEKASDETRVDIMFDRLMLTDLRENVEKLDNNVFAELHNYKIPPPMIHNILKAVLLLFYQDNEEQEQFEDWVECKKLATSRLKQQILTFDPTVVGVVSEETVRRISELLKGIAHGAVAKHGSIPAQQLYNWAFVCLSLIEHTKKMRDNYGQMALTPVTSASTATTTDTQDTETY